jgi:hypothetical protein
VKVLEKIADLFWEGMTLKHISEKKIVTPYYIFFIQALIFELFLIVLFGISFFLSIKYNVIPNMIFYLSGAVLFLLLAMTVYVLCHLRTGKR